MGAWGVGSFENDDASDWVWVLEGTSDNSILESTLLALMESGSESECTEETNAIAAAEIVAILCNGANDDIQLLESVANYITRNSVRPSSKLVELAVTAVNRVLAKSEIQELWEESEEYEEWVAVNQGLITRLKNSK